MKNNMCGALRSSPPLIKKTTFSSIEEEREHKLRNKSCIYDKNYKNNYDSTLKDFSGEIMDIEDMFNDAKNKNVCPFYLGRDLLKPAHVVFLPYNYLLNDGYLDTVRDYIKDSIMIFDEAHNVSSTAEESQSFDFDTACLSAAANEIKEMRKFVQATQEMNDVNKYNTAGARLIKFLNTLA